MKTFALSFLLLTMVFGISNAQNVEIPDTTFLYALIDLGVDTNGDSLISTAEAEEIIALDVNYYPQTGNIKSLVGIEAFTNLDSLDCGLNKLTQLDLSNNIALSYLNCWHNELTSLNISDNVNLRYLNCAGNDQLTNLDISNNTSLVTLRCSQNYNITSLNVSNCIELETLSCSSMELTTLDISNNTALTYLHCGSNLLTELDISSNTALVHLECNGNFQLTSLDISNSKALKYLYCPNNGLTELIGTENSALENLRCDGNQLSQLNVSGCDSLVGLHCEENQLTNLNVSSCGSLFELRCYDNQITSLDISDNSELWILYCNHNQLTTLDLSNNINLKSIFCYNNQLTSLDVSNNVNSSIIQCHNNQLTSLDVSNNIGLRYLYCGGNQLKTLDISNNRDQITRLDISNMPTLYEVCVWAIPFPGQDYVNIISDGSPNVYFSDCIAPDLSISYQSEQMLVEATSSENGIFYLVPGDTDSLLTSIRVASIDSVDAIANTAVNISVAGLEHGEYWLYARDSTGNISKYEAFVIVAVGIDDTTDELIKLYPNPAVDQLTVESSRPGQHIIEITSLNGQLLYTDRMEGPTHQIDLSSFEKGLYFITIRSKDFVKIEKIIKQ